MHDVVSFCDVETQLRRIRTEKNRFVCLYKSSGTKTKGQRKGKGTGKTTTEHRKDSGTSQNNGRPQRQRNIPKTINVASHAKDLNLLSIYSNYTLT